MIFLGIGMQIALTLAGLFVARAALTTARTPQGAAAWVVFLIAFPLLAIPAFALFSSVARSTSPKGAQEAEATSAPAGARLDALTGIVGARVTEGNAATLLIDGRETFDAIFAAIDGAEREVLVQFYIIRADGTGEALRARLTAAARRGVDVRVLCDVVGSIFLGFRYVRALKAEGVRFQGIVAPHRALGRIGVNFRNHRKAVVVDGQIGFTGGINVGDEYIDGGARFDAWRDTHIRLEGPMVDQLRAIFAADWAGLTGETLRPAAELPSKPEAPGPCQGLVAGFGATDALERGSLLLCGLVGLATRRLWIATPYLVPHADLATALKLVALRGADVRILIPAPSDNVLAWYASRAAARDLVAAGIAVHAYRPGFMHSKVMLIDDDVASIGTVNLDIRSALLNFEETALIENRNFAARVEAMLAEDFARATPVEIPGPWHVRALAPVARLFGPLL
ncbi:cardiolipin synthase [uncultured Jannaschia sp.]|uniref:cardiolipin synthase n=1 Tax=uncultured Jannaschia sp. TaxID=293347 RepID=UPI0026395312|nr:cardiolipin synthase [uncultured Jannaschia sp.]